MWQAITVFDIKIDCDVRIDILYKSKI